MKSPSDATQASPKKTRAGGATSLRNGPAVQQPAHITITLVPGGWVDVINSDGLNGDDRLCQASWELVQPAPDGISQPGGAGTTIFVGRTMDIDFDLGPGAYTLAGIAFRRVRGNGPGTGTDDLKKENIRVEVKTDGSSTIHVKDSWKNHKRSGSLDRWSWDFFLFVQDAGGDIGIIDPDIENEEAF